VKTTLPTVLLLLRVFVAAITFLPSRCLATIGEIFTVLLPGNVSGDTNIDTQTDGRDL
jgi:hypothetical protein